MAIFVQDTLHMAERGSYYEGSVKIDGDFLVPPRTEFWKDIVVSALVSGRGKWTYVLYTPIPCKRKCHLQRRCHLPRMCD